MILTKSGDALVHCVHISLPP